MNTQTPSMPRSIDRETFRKLNVCFVRFKGKFRDTHLKIFFTDDVLMSEFTKRVTTFGDVPSVTFPVGQATFTYEEVERANNEHRLLVA